MKHLLRKFAAGILLPLLLSPDLGAQTDKVTTTPALLQQGFGPGGSQLPGDGENYCAPTSSANSVLWLFNNGYNRLYETPFASQSDNEANLVRALGGLMETSARGGTGSDGIHTGWSDYLNLKGYGDFEVETFEPGENITYADFDLDFLQSENTGYNVVNYGFLWGLTENGTDKIQGGHAVSLLKADPSQNEMIINNPAPFTPGDNPETHPVQTITFQGQSDVTALDFSSNFNGNPVWGIAGFATVIRPDAVPASTANPTTWTIGGDEVINTNGSYLTVEAPLAGTGRFIKTDSGDLDGTLVLKAGVGGLADPYTFSGGLVVDAGTLVVEEDSANPVGTGSAELSGGFLDFSPVGSGQDLSIALAADSGSTFTYSGGGGLIVDKGSHNSLELTLGGNTDGTTANLVRGDLGALVLIAEAGLAELGQSERIKVAGSGGNLPPLSNGIVDPHLVGADRTQSFDGSFLTYDNTRGFESFTGVDNFGTPLASMSSTTVAEITTNDSVTGSASVHAIRVGDGSQVGGTGTLSIGPGTNGSAGGVILNGGRLSTASLEFGQSEGVIYTGSRGGRIDSSIGGNDGVIYFGPGRVDVTGASTYGGGTLIQDGHLQVRNSTGSATGTGDILITRNGLLSGDGSVSGDVEVDGIVVPGVYGAGGFTPGTLSVGGDMVFDTDSIFGWTLTALTDSTGTGIAGSHWNFLSVGGELSFSEDSYLKLDFDEVAGPESGDSFWDQARVWSLASFGSLTGLSNFSIFGEELQFGEFQLFDDSNANILGLAYTPNGGQINPVPEPADIGFLLAVLSLFLVGFRRRIRTE